MGTQNGGGHSDNRVHLGEGWVPQPWLGLSAALALQSALDWWPRIDAVYCHAVELRSMFSDTLHRAMQGCGAHPAIRMTPVSQGALPPSPVPGGTAPSPVPALPLCLGALPPSPVPALPSSQSPLHWTPQGEGRGAAQSSKEPTRALQPCSVGGLALLRSMSLDFPAAFQLVTCKCLSCKCPLWLTVHFKLLSLCIAI